MIRAHINCAAACVSVCVCERERERDSPFHTSSISHSHLKGLYDHHHPWVQSLTEKSQQISIYLSTSLSLSLSIVVARTTDYQQNIQPMQTIVFIYIPRLLSLSHFESLQAQYVLHKKYWASILIPSPDPLSLSMLHPDFLHIHVTLKSWRAWAWDMWLLSKKTLHIRF